MSEELHDLAAAYALDALDELEEARFTRHLEACERCQADVTALRETAAALGGSDPEGPSPKVRDEVLRRVATTPQAGTRVAGRRGLWVGLGAAAAIAVLAFIGATILGDDGLIGAVLADPSAQTFQAEPTDAGAGLFDRVSIVYSAAHEAAVMVAEGLALVGEDRVYEMWLIDDTGPRPAGTFRPDRNGSAQVQIEGDVASGLVFALTEEPSGGVPFPTGEILLTSDIDA